MRSRWWRAITLVALALGAACSSSGDRGAEQPPSGPRVEWVNSDRHWVSQPEMVGGRFVAYFEWAGQLNVAGVEPMTGEMVWRVPASVSALTPGVAIDLAHDDERVYVGAPVDVGGTGSGVFVVAVDGASGVEVWRASEPLEIRSSLYDCEDDSATLCTSGGPPGTGRALAVRIAKGTGLVTMLPQPTSVSRTLGAGLYDLGGRDPERIAAIDPGGRTLWARTPTELFQGRPVSSDHGWNWERYGDLLVGWLGRTDGDGSHFDLSETSVTAVEAATGHVVWLVDGVDLGCQLGGRTLASDSLPLRCRMTGTGTRGRDGAEPVITGLDVVMERFDPATGATQWQAELGAATSIVTGKPALIRLSPREYVVGRDDGSSIVIDIESGQTRAPVLEDTGWCSEEDTFADLRTYGQSKRRRGHDFVTPCRFDGSPADAPPGPPDVAARFEQVYAWVDATGMHAATTGA